MLIRGRSTYKGKAQHTPLLGQCAGQTALAGFSHLCQFYTLSSSTPSVALPALTSTRFEQKVAKCCPTAHSGEHPAAIMHLEFMWVETHTVSVELIFSQPSHVRMKCLN